MKWLRENNCPWDTLTFTMAVICSNLENLKWLKENGCPLGDKYYSFLEYAIASGNLEIINWVKDIKNDVKDLNLFDCAIRYGNLEIMKWLKEQGCPWNEYTFEFAAKCGNLEIMKWLKKNGCPWDTNTFSAAVKYGNLEILSWLKYNNCPVDYVYIVEVYFHCFNLWTEQENFLYNMFCDDEKFKNAF